MRVLLVLLLAAAATAGASAPSDLDAFMARVLARRDDNWKKLQQYVLDEREQLRVVGPDGGRIYGFDRKYTWFIRDGIFVRSPLEADGVAISESERASYEQRWIRRERRREERAKQRERREAGADADADANADAADVEDEETATGVDVVSGTLQPRFVTAAYFLRFKFDPGHYALAGREQWNGREVLRIEYYPSRLFREGRTRPNHKLRERDDEIEEKMNKVSLVTLWIDPAEHQIVRYTFDNIDTDFLPGRSLVRIDELQASMTMTQPFPGVWLPADLQMRFGLTMAVGRLTAEYDVGYRDYRLADVKTRIKPPQ